MPPYLCPGFSPFHGERRLQRARVSVVGIARGGDKIYAGVTGGMAPARRSSGVCMRARDRTDAAPAPAAGSPNTTNTHLVWICRRARCAGNAHVKLARPRELLWEARNISMQRPFLRMSIGDSELLFVDKAVNGPREELEGSGLCLVSVRPSWIAGTGGVAGLPRSMVTFLGGSGALWATARPLPGA